MQGRHVIYVRGDTRRNGQLVLKPKGPTDRARSSSNHPRPRPRLRLRPPTPQATDTQSIFLIQNLQASQTRHLMRFSAFSRFFLRISVPSTCFPLPKLSNSLWIPSSSIMKVPCLSRSCSPYLRISLPDDFTADVAQKQCTVYSPPLTPSLPPRPRPRPLPLPLPLTLLQTDVGVAPFFALKRALEAPSSIELAICGGCLQARRTIHQIVLDLPARHKIARCASLPPSIHPSNA